MQRKDFHNVPIMWEPPKVSVPFANKFTELIQNKYNVKIGDYWDLHRWSVEHVAEFWEEVWNFSPIIYSKSYDQVMDKTAGMEDAPKWFQGARLNYAENHLRYRDDHVALILAGEDRALERVTYAEVYEEVCRYGAAFRKCGLKKGDRVVCFMSNRKEPLFAMLGATSIGAIWSGALPLLGAKAVLNRFKLIEPKFLFTVDRHRYDGEEMDMLRKVEEIARDLPSLEKVVVVPSKEESLNKDISKIKNSCFLEDFLSLGKNADGSIPPLVFEQLPFDHPIFISYTSGTTGKPKVIVHGTGGLLSKFKDSCRHSVTSRENVYLSTSPVGWATWNILATNLVSGSVAVAFEGVPFLLTSSYLWDLVDELRISSLFITPGTLDDLEKKGYVPTEKHHLKSLKVIVSGASVVKLQNYDFIYNKVKKDIMFGSAYGSTEMMGSCLLFDRTLPVYRGEISVPALGINVQCFNDEGKPVIGELGELVITTPNPSMALGLWGDKDGTLYKKTYFSKFKGVFTVGDFCIINPVTRGVIIFGRSDATLKQNGERFGSSEIYNVVDTFPEVRDSLCVTQYNAVRRERAVLFLKMSPDHQFGEDLVKRIRIRIERELSLDHVPEVIVETKEIPVNMTGKKMELIVKNIINGLPYDPETVINLNCLENFYNVPELQGY